MSAPRRGPGLVAVVALGGMVGTALRYALTSAVGSHGGFPTATFLENVVGAFLLGVLLETLLRRGEERRRERLLRLGLGTGLLGGFTTFSSLALEVTALLASGAVVTAALYGGASVVAGVLACLSGTALAAQLHRRRHARTRLGTANPPRAAGPGPGR
ncbi:MAG TPA: CrcB family protein [Actinotalea sp.]|nr:CrcB family protein [Actinotalea sp.]